MAQYQEITYSSAIGICNDSWAIALQLLAEMLQDAKRKTAMLLTVAYI